MKGFSLAVAAGVAVLALAGCASIAGQPVAEPSPSPSPTSSAAPTPSTRTSPTIAATSTSRTAPATPKPALNGDVRNDALLGSNPVFLEQGVGTGQVECRLPAWRNTAEANRDYYQAAIGCLDESWQPTLAHFRLTLASPHLWAGASAQSYDGACASMDRDREAFYCNRDQTIVMPFDTMNPLTGSANGAGAAFAVISHEYGHHVQQLSGVLDEYIAQRKEAGWTSEPGLQMSRQLELQAWCFSGMFFGANLGHGSISRDLWNKAYSNNSGAGDRPGGARDHGRDQNVSNWFGWGAKPTLNQNENPAPSMYECNPWAARDNGWIQ